MATQNTKKCQWNNVYENEDNSRVNDVILALLLYSKNNCASKVKFQKVKNQIPNHRVVEYFLLEFLDANLPFL